MSEMVSPAAMTRFGGRLTYVAHAALVFENSSTRFSVEFPFFVETYQLDDGGPEAVVPELNRFQVDIVLPLDPQQRLDAIDREFLGPRLLLVRPILLTTKRNNREDQCREAIMTDAIAIKDCSSIFCPRVLGTVAWCWGKGRVRSSVP
jgi:hypothetical protein